MAGRAGDGVIDVLGLGIVTVDDLLYVDRYPEPEEKVRVRARIRQAGGCDRHGAGGGGKNGGPCAGTRAN